MASASASDSGSRSKDRLSSSSSESSLSAEDLKPTAAKPVVIESAAKAANGKMGSGSRSSSSSSVSSSSRSSSISSSCSSSSSESSLSVEDLKATATKLVENGSAVAAVASNGKKSTSRSSSSSDDDDRKDNRSSSSSYSSGSDENSGNKTDVKDAARHNHPSGPPESTDAASTTTKHAKEDGSTSSPSKFTMAGNANTISKSKQNNENAAKSSSSQTGAALDPPNKPPLVKARPRKKATAFVRKQESRRSAAAEAASSSDVHSKPELPPERTTSSSPRKASQDKHVPSTRAGIRRRNSVSNTTRVARATDSGSNASPTRHRARDKAASHRASTVANRAEGKAQATRQRSGNMSLLPSQRARMAGALFALSSPPKTSSKIRQRSPPSDIIPRRSSMVDAGRRSRREAVVTDLLREIEGHRLLPVTLSQYKKVLDDPEVLASNPILKACVSGNSTDLSSLLSSLPSSGGDNPLRAADTSLQNKFTALHIAVVQGLPQAIPLLLAAGASRCVRDYMGRTPMHIAILNDNLDCVQELLIFRGAPASEWSMYSVPDKQGNCPLHLAVLAAAYAPEAKILDDLDSNSNSDVDAAASSQIPRSKFDICEALVLGIQRHVQVDPDCAKELSRPNRLAGFLTPLHFAVRSGSRLLVEWLCEVALFDEGLVTMRGTRKKRSIAIPAERVKQMSHKRACSAGLVDISARDEVGDTPLHHASATGSEPMVALLVRMGAKVDIKNNAGQTPLHIAAASLSDDACFVLVQNGADVGIRYHAAEILRGREHDELFGSHDLKDCSSDDDELAMLSKADRFGFIREPDSPKAEELNTVARSTLAAEKKRKLELKRATKWAKMATNYHQFERKHPSKLRARIYKGLPDALRGRMWVQLLGADRAPEGENADWYIEHRGQHSKDSNQIDVDVLRSQRDHVQFKERYGAGQVALYNILTAYSLWDKKVGYCQGMSDVTAFLLMYMLEEEAFRALTVLVRAPKYAMAGRLEDGFPDVYKSVWVHERLLEKHLPRLFWYFKGRDSDMPASAKTIGVKKGWWTRDLDCPFETFIYSQKWFMMAFLDELPLETLQRVWDVFFYEGYYILYSVALSILRLCESQMLQLPFEDLMTFKGLHHPLKRTVLADADTFMADVAEHKIKRSVIAKLEQQYDREHAPERAAKHAASTAARRQLQRKLKQEQKVF